MASGGQVSSDSLSDFIKTHYDKKLIEHAEAKVYYYQFAEKRPIPKQGGKTIEFTIARPIATGAILTEGTSPTQKYLSADKITLTLHQLGDWAAVTDYVDWTAITNQVSNALKRFKEQAPRTIDKFIGHSLYSVCDYATRSALAELLHNEYATTGSTVRLWSGQGTGNAYDGFPMYNNKTRLTGSALVSDSISRTALSVKTIRHAVLKLRERSIEPFADGSYMAITHPGAIYDLRSSSAWKSWQQYTTPELMAKGEVGQIEGVRFVANPNYNKFSLSDSDNLAASSAALYTTFIFGKGAYGVTEMGGLSWHVVNKADSYNPLALWRSVGWKVMMAACTLNKSAGVVVATTEKY